ncbi:antibiotic biosynthesis monooxygenase [Levilactobacillus andaensis]|uniref:antibiotic biosynthesis monooxygenase n=1 Tax=Levilactobacillus andaensis TaxID=2799570 RepID=UPI001941DA00|nr:antibiotic biosynthesis monooxygenase [Levilactobacillus andaensis]
MLHRLSLTFGTRDLLGKIIARNPQRQLILMEIAGDDEGLQLLDVTDEPTIFTGGLDYRVQLHQGARDWLGFFNFSYFTFDHDTATVFDAKMNQLASNVLPAGMTAMYVLTKEHNAGEYVLLTQWVDSEAFSLWRHSAAFTPIAQYASSANHFHTANYHQIKPDAPDSNA